MSTRMVTIIILTITNNSICIIQGLILKRIQICLHHQLPTWRYQSHGRNAKPMTWAHPSKKTSRPKPANAKVSWTSRIEKRIAFHFLVFHLEKGTEETEKFVEHSLQQLRDLPMLTPLEPAIDISNDLSLSLPFEISEKSKFQGDFGQVFIDSVQDYYRPHRRPPLKHVPSIANAAQSLSALERRYRLCSTLLDHPPSLPSPPLALDTNDKLPDLLSKEPTDIRDDESVVSTSTLADDENLINDIETENIQLLKTLSYNRELRSLSPLLTFNDLSTTKNSELPPATSTAMTPMTTTATPTTVDIKTEMSETSAPPGGNELEKKERPLVEGTDKVSLSRPSVELDTLFSSSVVIRFQWHWHWQPKRRTMSKVSLQQLPISWKSLIHPPSTFVKR